MKNKTLISAKPKNFAVTVPAELIPEIKRRAADEELTVSAYLRRLIKTDLKTLKEPHDCVDIIK
jgi:hypothetical protein